MATETDKVNNGALATLIAVVALGVIGVALAVTALTRKQVYDEAMVKEGLAQVGYAKLLKSQHEALAQGMSIETAMQTVVRELAKNPQAASPPPPATAEAVAAGGAGGAGGAAPAVPAAPAGGTSGGAAGAAAPGSPKPPTPANRPAPEHNHAP
jgi:hypothetical protein